MIMSRSKQFLTIGTGESSIEVELINKPLNEWYVSIEEDYKPDYRKFITDKFEQKYPALLGKYEWTQLNSIISRNEQLLKYKALVDGEYSITANVPKYYEQVVDKDQYSAARIKLSELKKIEANRAQELISASEDYKEICTRIDAKYEKKLSEFDFDNITLIASLPSTKLPLSVQMLIEDYSPADTADSNTKRKFAREMLIRYKIALLKAHNDGKDVRKLIEENVTK